MGYCLIFRLLMIIRFKYYSQDKFCYCFAKFIQDRLKLIFYLKRTKIQRRNLENVALKPFSCTQLTQKYQNRTRVWKDPQLSSRDIRRAHHWIKDKRVDRQRDYTD
jgi:hypothetical protein